MARNKVKKNQDKKTKAWDLYFLIVSSIIIIPLIYVSKTIDPVLSPRMLGLSIVVFIGLIISLVTKEKNGLGFTYIKLPVFIIFAAYIIWSIITLIPSINPGEGITDISKSLLIFTFLILTTQVFIKHEKAIDILTKSVIISSLFASGLGFYQYIESVGGNHAYTQLMAFYEIKGLMAHKNQFAISLFLMLPFTIFGIFTFKKIWRGLSIYSTFALLLNIVMLQTRSVWVATIVLLVSVGFLWLLFSSNKNITSLFKKSLIVLSIIVFVAIGSMFIFKSSGTVKLLKNQFSSIFDTKSHNNEGRMLIWKASARLIADNPIMGVGSGNWRISIIPYYSQFHGVDYRNWRRPHNDYIWVMSEKGFLGFILYFAVFGMIIIYGFKILLRRKQTDNFSLIVLMLSTLFSYMIISMFTFPMERINHQIYLVFIMAIIIGTYYKGLHDKPHFKTSYNNYFMYGLFAISILSIYVSKIQMNSDIKILEIDRAMKLKQYKKAIKLVDDNFSIFASIDHNGSPFYLYRGISNLSLENLKQAEIDFKMALGYFPYHISALNNLAIVSAKLNKSDQAIKYLKQGLELYPSYQESLFNLANVYYRDKNYDQAYLYLLRGNTQFKNKNYDKFKQVLEELINQ